MTVQELIDALNKVEDKSLPVYYYYNGLGDYEEIDEIEKNMRIERKKNEKIGRKLLNKC